MKLLQEIITAIKRVFRRHITVYVVDTSAWSNHFDTVKKYLEIDNNHKVLIPEKVINEISEGKQKGIPRCIAIYDFFENNIGKTNKNPRIIVKKTPNEQKSWRIADDIIIEAAISCQKDGYTTIFVTSDNPEGFKTEALHSIETIKLKVNNNRARPKREYGTPNNEFVKQNISHNIPKDDVHNNTDIELNSKMRGKELWIDFNKNVLVHDADGKRKIFPKEGMRILRGDTIYYNGKECDIKTITPSRVILKAKKSG